VIQRLRRRVERNFIFPGCAARPRAVRSNAFGVQERRPEFGKLEASGRREVYVMTDLAPITYRGYYDVPRMFVLTYRGAQLLFDCPFEDDLDDYSAHYTVYRLPAEIDPPNVPSWYDLPALGTKIGAVPVSDVRFDSTRRQAVNTREIDRFAEQQRWFR